MKISQLLTLDTVITPLDTPDAETASRQLIETLARVKGIDAARAIKDTAARERKASTLFDAPPYRIAIPHASTQACRQLVMALGISPQGVPWLSGGQRANVVFAVLCPPQAHGLYLKVMGRIARLCQDAHFIKALLEAHNAQQAIELLTNAEAPLGEIVAAEGMPTFCVLGAGNGGMAMAGHLAITGCHVNLYNHNEDRLQPVRQRGGIEVVGQIEGFATLGAVTTVPAEAIANVDVLMVVVPANAHRSVAEAVARHIKDGQILVLNPGRTGGALEVAKIIHDINPAVRPYIAEAQTLLYASRVTNPGQVHIFGIKNSVPLSTLPSYLGVDVLPVIRKALPQFVPGDNVLKTSLDNIGAVFHPTVTVLNAGRIEDTHGDFEYYIQGVTPAVASVLEAVDSERVAVAAALGIRANTAREWLYLAYDAPGRTLLEAMRANPGYRGIKAPATIVHRYIFEDVPTSLVPIASIGEMLGVPTPTIRTIIHLASAMHGVDYWAEGRTVDRLGLRGLSVKQINLLIAGAAETAENTGGAQVAGTAGIAGIAEVETASSAEQPAPQPQTGAEPPVASVDEAERLRLLANASGLLGETQNPLP